MTFGPFSRFRRNTALLMRDRDIAVHRVMLPALRPTKGNRMSDHQSLLDGQTLPDGQVSADYQLAQCRRLMQILLVATVTACGLQAANAGALAASASEQHVAQAQPATPDITKPAAPDNGSPPAAAPKPTPSAAPPAKTAETPAVVVNSQQVESVLGKKVRSASGDDMGRIVDIIADKSGQLRAAIIDFGGFLGVGSKQIAVDWKAIRFAPDAKTDAKSDTKTDAKTDTKSDTKTDAVILDLTRDQLRVAPAYKAGEQIVILGQPAVATPPAAPADASTPAAAPRVQDSQAK
jgi:hypothetical protein